ncbi:MAG: C4-dicarboxylate ABC transporter substrate-binding protein, partial [Actinobacteria bacterium]
TYKGHDRETATPAVMATLVARADLAEDLVPQFHAAHPAARSLTPQTAPAGMALPLHPGAQRFFKEKGIAR